MHIRRGAFGALTLLISGLAAFAPAGGSLSAGAADAPAFSIANVAPKDGGGEPSIATAPNGNLYVSYPASGGMDFYRSSDFGVTWKAGKTKADTASGDTCVATDQAGSVYQCNLAGSAETAPLQADVFKSVDAGDHWLQGGAFVSGGAGVCGASCNPFGVDRQWTSAWIPPGKTTAEANVVLMYHDFYGPSQIWVNVSNDGGATYGQPKPVLANPALTATGLTGTGQAQFYTICNSIPAAVQTERTGPHPGRIYVSWIAADAPQNALGCNVSQAEAFHTLWVAWSDDQGNTWTPQLAFDGGVGHDASSPFVGFTLDNQGNPYFGFTDNLTSDPTCTAAITTACEYDMYVVWSPDGGTTWQGGNGPTGALPTPGKPFKVNGDTGTHFYPAIAAQNPGEVEVAWLRTEAIIPTDPAGKATPGGGAGDAWNLYSAQTRNLNAANPAAVTWAISRITPVPMHVGDICNLGIACVSRLGSNRNLLDFISIVLDNNGCAHIAYTDDNKFTGIRSANQTASCLSAASVTSQPVTVATPTNPAALPLTSVARPLNPSSQALLLAALGIIALAIAGALGVARRRAG